MAEAANANQPIAADATEPQVQEATPEPASEVVAEPVPVPEPANDNGISEDLPATGTD